MFPSQKQLKVACIQMSSASATAPGIQQEQNLPESYQRVVASGIASSFREAAHISTVHLEPPGADEVTNMLCFHGPCSLQT